MSKPHQTYTILHTESSLGWGGQERRILAEAAAMRERGHRLLLACDPKGELFPRGRRAGFPVLPLSFGGWRNFPAGLALRRFLLREGVDFLNTHSSLDTWVGTLALTGLKKPFLVRTRHLSTPVKMNRPTRWLYNTPRATITTSRSIKELLQERLGVPGDKIFAIPTGVSLQEFAPRQPDAALLEKLLIPQGSFIWGMVSVLRSWKGHLYALEALKELVDAGIKTFLVVVGEGPYRSLIEPRIQELGLEDRVRLAGYQEDVAPWLALMDVVAMASYAHEGVPQAVLQAMAMGKPVVGTMVGGIPEVIVPRETGLLVPPKDSSALAAALRRLWEHPGLRTEMGRKGREMVHKKYSLEQMALAVERVYDLVWRDIYLGGKGEKGKR
ncbi:MAG: glycosyltransferase family 1 protein [Deltaproteobacteria bacterium]|nr:MAG: glycosyltransferase family 1 protein [Deltaproteobacteria bacterium]